MCASQSKDICLLIHMVIVFPSWEQQDLKDIKTVDTFISRPRGTRSLDAVDSCNERKWSIGDNTFLRLFISDVHA